MTTQTLLAYRWFLFACVAFACAFLFLLAFTGTTDAFMDALDRVWKFAAGAVAAGIALKARSVVAAKKDVGS